MAAALRIALAGLGTVGAGLVRLIEANGALIERRAGRPIEIVAVSARYPGLCHSVLGNEPQALESLVEHLHSHGHRRFAWLGGNVGLGRHEARLQAYRAEQRLEPDAPVSRTADPQHWRLTRDLTLAREASRHAVKSAQAAHETVFAEGGALAQLRAAHPAAYVRLAQRAARHGGTQLQRVPTQEPALRALVDDARAIASRATTELAAARQEGRLHAIGDAGLSVR